MFCKVLLFSFVWRAGVFFKNLKGVLCVGLRGGGVICRQGFLGLGGKVC